MPSVVDMAGGGECQACKGCGLIYPPRRARYGGSARNYSTPAVRAMPVPCSLCAAGALEAMLWADLEAKGLRGAEVEIRAFRKAKG